MFDSLSHRLNETLSGLKKKGRLTETDITKTAKEIRTALLEADVALPVVRAFIARVKQRALGHEVSAALNPAQQIIKIVSEELTAIIGGKDQRRLLFAKNPPTIIMLVGLQGAGKTTLAGKLASWLKNQGHTPLLVACDLQRPGAVRQLEIMAEKAEVAAFSPHPGTSIHALEAEMTIDIAAPVSVAREGLRYAQHHHHDVMIVDTAGRLGVDQTMMDQAAAIKEATNPDEILFVMDSMIGQDAVFTAQSFADNVDFSGVVLTKLDGDTRGGAALSVREVTGKPILFASTGEKIEAFDVFHPDRMARRILGMGDVLSLIEQAEKVLDEDKAQAAANKIVQGELTLDDFLEQMLMMRKLGPISNLMGMMPGGGQLKQAMGQINDKELDKVQAIIRGMTPAERMTPKIINGSRRQRIAAGSGVSVSDVNNLVDRFFQAKKMMSSMMGGMGGNKKSSRNKKKKGKNISPRIPKVPGLSMPNMDVLTDSQKNTNGIPKSLENFDFSKFPFPKQ